MVVTVYKALFSRVREASSPKRGDNRTVVLPEQGVSVEPCVAGVRSNGSRGPPKV